MQGTGMAAATIGVAAIGAATTTAVAPASGSVCWVDTASGRAGLSGKLPQISGRNAMTATAHNTAHRPAIAVTRHAIAAGHYLAATAGFDILQAGGNAIDAGVALASGWPE